MRSLACCLGTKMVQDQEGDFGVVMAFRSFFKMVWPDFHGNFLEMVLMRVFSPFHPSSCSGAAR